MNDAIYRRIEESPRFKDLVARRERFAWRLSAVMLGLYFSYILLIAFAPHSLGRQISAGSSVTWGMPIGIGLIVIAFVLTGVYVRRANGEFDSLNQALLDEVQEQ